MTREWFNSQMARLTVLPFPPADIEEYWPALRDIPPQTFKEALGVALRTRTRFPVPAELRMDADAAARLQAPPQAMHPTSRLVPVEGVRTAIIRNPFSDDRSKDITVTITDVLEPVCDDCDDSGWVSYWCGEEPSKVWPWLYMKPCDRRHSHGRHEWSDICHCVATNPVILRKKAHQAARYSEEPQKAGR